MKAFLAIAFFSASVAVSAEPCFGPGGCEPPGPTGPAELCIETCAPVGYSWSGDFAVAQSTLANGYPVAGIVGPCPSSDHAQCPDIFNQAFAVMRSSALQAHRAQRY